MPLCKEERKSLKTHRLYWQRLRRRNHRSFKDHSKLTLKGLPRNKQLSQSLCLTSFIFGLESKGNDSNFSILNVYLIFYGMCFVIPFYGPCLYHRLRLQRSDSSLLPLRYKEKEERQRIQETLLRNGSERKAQCGYNEFIYSYNSRKDKWFPVSKSV